MLWKVEARVILKSGVLDAPGQVIETSLHKLGFAEVTGVRVGKHISMQVEADSADAAGERVREMGRRLLANPVVEDFDFELAHA